MSFTISYSATSDAIARPKDGCPQITQMNKTNLCNLWTKAELAFDVGGQINYWLNTFAKKSHV
jgi:hypothetical protein